MAIREIKLADAETLKGHSESVLRTEYTEVREIDDHIIRIVKDLRDTLHSDGLSVGLAAPQIGHPEAVIIVNLDKKNDQDMVFINPKIISNTGSHDIKFESCMSIPHKRGQVKRKKKLSIQYIDLDGAKQELNTSSFLARVIMHEIDHLNGILYTDHMESLDDLEDTQLFRDHGIS